MKEQHALDGLGWSLAKRSARLALFVLITMLAPGARPANSACNLIPVAQRVYPSTLGAITSPITAPGKTVVVAVTPCDASPGFERVATDNVVTLTFQPPGAGADTPVSITSLDDLSVGDCGTSRCSTLSFVMPDTSSVLPPNGLAGPARITVRDSSSALVAEIDQLFLPALSCDRQPETVFRQLTVLPEANSFADAVAGVTTELRATLDGSGSLLVPFDYWGGGTSSVLAETPGAPVAIFLEGSFTLDAFNSAPGVPIAIPSSDFVRAFTLNGRPLPPLLRVTDSGGLYGTADAVESVLRVAKNDGTGGADLYDLSDRLSAGGKGPILVDTFQVAVNQPVPLKGLRSSSETVAFTRDEAREAANLNAASGDADAVDLVAEVIDAQSGAGMSTAKAVTEVPNGPFVAPALVTSGGSAAFLESELGQGSSDLDGNGDVFGNILRVFASQGGHLTASLAENAAFGPLVDGRSLAVSGTKTFIRRPGAFVDAELEDVGGVSGMGGASAVTVSPDGAHVYVASYTEGLSTNGVAVFARDQANGGLSFVDAETDGTARGATSIAVSPDGHDIYVARPGFDAVSAFTRDEITGSLTFLQEEFTSPGGVLSGTDDSSGIAVSGAHVYAGRAVFARDQLTGELTFLESHLGVLSGADAVAISPDGANVYIASGAEPALAVFGRHLVTGALTHVETQTDGIGEPTPGAGNLLGGLAISPDGRHVYMTGSVDESLMVFTRDPYTGAVEPIETYFDITGVVGAGAAPSGVTVTPDGAYVYVSAGGSVDALVVFRRNQSTGALTYVESQFEGVGGVVGIGGPAGVAVSPGGDSLYVAGRSSSSIAAFRTRHTLGVFDDISASLLVAQPAAGQVAVAAERAAILTPEAFDGIDLNGDEDAMLGGDEVAQLYDASISPAVVRNLGVAASRVAISPQVVALTAREANANALGAVGSDLNDDGDILDDVLHVYEIGTAGAPRNVGVAADAIAVAGSRVVFVTREADEWAFAPGCLPTTPAVECDLNGDGDGSDRVVRVYDQDTRKNTEIRQAAEEIVVEGDLAAFRTSESDQGIDLNGDGGIVDTDRVMQVYDLASGGLVSTRTTAIVCELPGCERSVPYKLKGDTVSFLTDEQDEGNGVGADRNGDGDGVDIVLTVFSLSSRRSQTVATVVDNDGERDVDAPAPLPADAADGGTIVYASAIESAIGEDINGDGIIDDAAVILIAGDADDDGTFDDFDTCVETANGDQIDIDADGLGDTTCDPDPVPCTAVPFVGCRTVTEPGKASIAITNSDDDTRDALKWSWSRGSATTLADLGDPVRGVAAYSVCVYDGSANEQSLLGSVVLPAGTCEGKACWRATGAKGFKFKDKTRAQGGVEGIALKTGESGAAKITVKGRGAGLGVRDLPVTAPVTVQFVVNDGARLDCWEATYGTLAKNEGGQLKAKSD